MYRTKERPYEADFHTKITNNLLGNTASQRQWPDYGIVYRISNKCTITKHVQKKTGQIQPYGTARLKCLQKRKSDYKTSV